MKRDTENTIPSESTEQKRLFAWMESAAPDHPELLLAFHIPNGGTRQAREAHNLRLQGVRRGVPDIFLPVPRGDFHGLFVEMKRQRGGVVSEHQKAWIRSLRAMGYRAEVCKGFEAARDVIIDYLERGT